MAIMSKIETMNRMFGCAVPLLSFGGAILGIVIWMNNITVDIRISIIGCMLASCVLAYLAWIQPRKDLVALTTPLYSIVFMRYSLDDVTTIVLEMLYAMCLTILLVRLKYQFITPESLVPDKDQLSEPIRSYVEMIRESPGSITRESAHSAAMVFVRFAEGDFLAATQVAKSAISGMNDTSAPRSVQNAFAIVREQAERLEKSFPRPEYFLTFSPEDASVLAKTSDPNTDSSEKYDVALENALILLFACAWIASDKDHSNLFESQAFLLKLLN
ncbi:MAG: hypothetical protein Q7J03_01920 [Methanoregula sp.]|nr:hypothetical protein [Methanoregula sp.]